MKPKTGDQSLLAEPWIYSSLASEKQNGYHFVLFGKGIETLPRNSSIFDSAVVTLREQEVLPSEQLLACTSNGHVLIMRPQILQSDWKGRKGTYVSGYALSKEAIQSVPHGSFLSVDWSHVGFPSHQDAEKRLESSEVKSTPITVESIELPIRDLFLDERELSTLSTLAGNSVKCLSVLESKDMHLHLTFDTIEEAYSLLRFAHILLPYKKRWHCTFAIHPVKGCPKVQIQLQKADGEDPLIEIPETESKSFTRIVQQLKKYAGNAAKFNQLLTQVDQASQSVDLAVSDYWAFIADVLERECCFCDIKQPLPEAGPGLIASMRARYLINAERTLEQMLDGIMNSEASEQAITSWLEKLDQIFGEQKDEFMQQWKQRLANLSDQEIVERLRAWRSPKGLIRRLRICVEKNPSALTIVNNLQPTDINQIEDPIERFNWIRLIYNRLPAWLGEHSSKIPEIYQADVIDPANPNKDYILALLQKGGDKALYNLSRSSIWNPVFQQFKKRMVDRCLKSVEFGQRIPFSQLSCDELFSLHASAHQKGYPTENIQRIETAIRKAIIAEHPKMPFRVASAPVIDQSRISQRTLGNAMTTRKRRSGRWLMYLMMLLLIILLGAVGFFFKDYLRSYIPFLGSPPTEHSPAPPTTGAFRK